MIFYKKKARNTYLIQLACIKSIFLNKFLFCNSNYRQPITLLNSIIGRIMCHHCQILTMVIFASLSFHTSRIKLKIFITSFLILPLHVFLLPQIFTFLILTTDHINSTFTPTYHILDQLNHLPPHYSLSP